MMIADTAALQPIDDDAPITGVRAIAKVIGRTESQTFYALERGYYDATKRGRIWQSTRRRLLGPPPTTAPAPPTAEPIEQHDNTASVSDAAAPSI
jgi:hypothetical protein